MPRHTGQTRGPARSPGNRRLRQLQAATIDRGDTAIADERRQMLGPVFTQPTSRRGNGECVGPRSSLLRQQSPERRFPRLPGRRNDSISRDRILHTLDDSFARQLGQCPGGAPRRFTGGESQLTMRREFEILL
jgi:hypothetical protein